MPFDKSTGNWTPPVPHLNNYTVTHNTDKPGSGNIGQMRWVSDRPETCAWMCNQNTNCAGFVAEQGNSRNQNFTCWYTDWYNYNRTTSVSSTGLDLYSKINKYQLPTFFQPDPTDPSILPFGRNTSGVRLDPGGNSGDNNSCIANGSSWLQTNPGFISPSNITTGTRIAADGGGNWTYSQQPSGYGNDSVRGYQIPLGWKFIFFENGAITGGTTEGYFNTSKKDSTNQDYSGCYNIDAPVNHEFGGRMTDGFIENIGFDIPSNWDNMTLGRGITLQDELAIKQNWCSNVSPSMLVSNASRCKGKATDNQTTIMSDEQFDNALIQGVKADTAYTWATQVAVINEMKRIVQDNTVTGGQGTVLNLFNTYCNAQPTDVKCSCINASKYSFSPGTSNCFDAANSGYPGCADYQYNGVKELGLTSIISPVFGLPTGVATTAINSLHPASAGCLMHGCTHAANNQDDQGIFPYDTAACPAENIQICNVQVNIGAAQDSPINATCTQTQVTNTPPSSAPSASPSSASPSSTPSSPSTSTSSGKSNTPLFIGGGVFCCCVFLIIIIAVVMMQGD